MSRHKPHLTDMRCMGMFCNTRVPSGNSDRGLVLCQEHLLLAWSIVQSQIDTTSGSPFEVPGASEKAEPSTREENEGRFGWVYYLRVGDLIKIGFSTSPEKRLAQYPPDSCLLAIRRGTRKMEKAEHIRYDKHLSDGREWFQYSKELELDICTEDDRGPNCVDGWESGEGRDWKRRKADPRTRVEYRKQRMVG